MFLPSAGDFLLGLYGGRVSSSEFTPEAPRYGFLLAHLLKRRRTWVIQSVRSVVSSSRRPQRRATAIEMLGDLRAVESFDDAVKALDSPELTSSAIAALRQIRDPRAVPALLPFLQNQSEHIRFATASCLRTLGWRAGTPSEAAVDAIARDCFDEAAAHGVVAVSYLIDRLKDDRFASSGRAILQLIETCRDPNVVIPLVLASLKPENQRPFLNGCNDVFGTIAKAAKGDASPLSLRTGDLLCRQRITQELKALLICEARWGGNLVFALDALGWTPDGPYDAALRLIALGRWEEAISLGDAGERAALDVFRKDDGWSGVGYVVQQTATAHAVNELLGYLKVERKGEVAFRTISRIIENNLRELSVGDLTAISHLTDYARMVEIEEGDDHPWYGRSLVWRPEPVPCPELAAAATEELQRRADTEVVC